MIYHNERRVQVKQSFWLDVGSMTISLQQQPSDDDQHYSDTPLPSAPRYPCSTVAINNPDGASIPNEVFNLVKAIVGVGVLSLPAGTLVFNFSSLSNSTWAACILMMTHLYLLSCTGVAAFGDAPSAMMPAPNSRGTV